MKEWTLATQNRKTSVVEHVEDKEESFILRWIEEQQC